MCLSRNANFFPNAALLFPIVKRFAVDFVDGSFRDRHAAGLSGHEEIDVVNLAVSGFHIDTREIFATAETGKPVIMNFDQIKRQVFARVVDVKLFVSGFSALAIDVSFDSGRNISVANRVHPDALRSRGALRRSAWYLGQLVDLWRLLIRVLRTEAR